MDSIASEHLVSFSSAYSTTSQSSASTTADSRFQPDLVNFLSIVQHCKIDYLPITWQEHLGLVGRGNSGKISRSLVKSDLDFAYKRFHTESRTQAHFIALISEVLILTQPTIRAHPNLMNLEGVCWEILRETEEVIPVLVFEKATWDLQKFMETSEGKNMTLANRLDLCADIGSAIKAMHDASRSTRVTFQLEALMLILCLQDIIHGDIKPQNIFVFKDYNGSTSFRVSDFGYSTMIANQADIVYLPKTVPWNAPEVHHRGFSPYYAKKTDIYSFGMLLFWVLFREHIPNTHELRRLKEQDEIEKLFNQWLAYTEPSVDQTGALKVAFSKIITKDVEERVSDLGPVLKVLGRKSDGAQVTTCKMLDTAEILSWHRGFRIAPALVTFMNFDFRIRKKIKVSLEESYIRHQQATNAEAIAFQLAFCYLIGFGVPADRLSAATWLESSGKDMQNLVREKDDVQHGSLHNRRMQKLTDDGVGIESQSANDYLSWGKERLVEAIQVYIREIADLRNEFGQYHPVVIRASMKLAVLNQGLGCYKEAKLLQETIYDQIKQDQSENYDDGILDLLELQMINSFIELGEWGHAQAIQESKVERSKRHVGEDHMKTVDALAILAIIYSLQGRYIETEKLEQKVLKIKTSVLGPQHPDTLMSVGALARTYYHQGRWTEAEQLETAALGMRKSVLGIEHPDTLGSMGDLAREYNEQGRYAEAEALEAEVLDIKKRVLGPAHPKTLLSMGNLALTYHDQGRWSEAESLYSKVVESWERTMGPEHPDTLITMGNLAEIYREQGKFSEAESKTCTVLEIRKRTIGPEHPDTITVMGNLAGIYLDQGRWAEAESLQSDVLELRKRVLGPEHPKTLASMGNLAAIYGDQGRPNEAEKLEVDALDIRRRVLGAEHPDTLTSMGNLSISYYQQRRWAEAERLELEVLDIRKRVLGPEHPNVVLSLGTLASIYSRQGRWAKAQKLNEVVVDINKWELGQDHPDTLTSMRNLAETYQGQGRWAEAAQLQYEALVSSRRVLGEEHPKTLINMGNLALTYQNLGQWTEAQKLEVEVLTLKKKVLGAEHVETITSMGNLATLYYRQGEWKMAEELEAETLEIKKRILGSEHEHTLTSMGNLGVIYYRQERWAEAERLQVQVLQLTRGVFGLTHPNTVQSMRHLRLTYTAQGRQADVRRLEAEVFENVERGN